MYEMQPICYNMYKWGLQMDVGVITEKSQNNFVGSLKGDSWDFVSGLSVLFMTFN